MSDKIFAVAVDGPSGAGKSTLAKAVAAELGIVYVDTGAIYRSIGCYMHDHQIDPHDAQAVAAALPQVRIQIRYGADGLQRMILNDEDVTDRIRLPEMSKFASAVSAIPAVRAFLLDMQRDMAKQHSVIMDGHRYGRPPGRGREDLSHRRGRRARAAPHEGAGRARYAPPL